MNLYVGNIPYSCTEEELKTMFGQHGEVKSVKIIIDRETNRSKGFGFVEMADQESGMKAIQGLNEYKMAGRPIKVNEARPKENSGGGMGGGGSRRPPRSY